MHEKTITAVPITGIPEINPGDDLSSIITDATRRLGEELRENDILVISSKIVSKAENRIVAQESITITDQAHEIAQRNQFDPFQVELALRESRKIIRNDRVLITETHSGFICNFSGVDKSNAPEGLYILLPKDPDSSAEQIRNSITKSIGKDVAIIISDTQGRPWRRGSINVTIGCAGISPFKFNKGRKDLYGRILEHSTVCHVDELASLAEPLMGQAGQGVPIVIIRGYSYTDSEDNAKDINRSEEEDMFR